MDHSGVNVVIFFIFTLDKTHIQKIHDPAVCTQQLHNIREMFGFFGHRSLSCE